MGDGPIGDDETERDLDELRRHIDENLGTGRNRTLLGGRLAGRDQRPGRVLRRTETERAGDDPAYLPDSPWWRGRWFLLLLVFLGVLVAASGLGLLPFGDDDGSDGNLTGVTVPTTTTTYPTTTTTKPTTTTRPTTTTTFAVPTTTTVPPEP